MNQLRSQILDQCRQKASHPPTVFSLTVPTGGGKTLASLAFALKHAVKYQKDRIIYVIPYTSIIEQTADVFRHIPGFESAVVEHHSNLAEVDESKETVRNRLATENWDAPLIVTTSVQFFESLYACRTSRCRKLHNIVNSVVIFDEAQCLPPAFLRPAVFAIRELHRHYKVTPILCTATQPVLTQVDEFDFKFKEGFDAVEEIIDDPELLARNLKRVNMAMLRNGLDPVDFEEVSEIILSEGSSVLAIVNRKDDARRLAKLLPQESTIHLSTNMCAQHRTEKLKLIKDHLYGNNAPLYVVSTSLVEAGVDIDFPVVYRALAGLDSIAQAAGRCNREGKLKKLGKTVVFNPVKQPGFVRQPASLAKELMDEREISNLLSPENYHTYFKQRFWQLGQDALDEKQIIPCFSKIMNYYFRTAAEMFHLIDDDWQESIIVPYGEAVNLLDQLINTPFDQKGILRKLGRYSVAIPKQQVEILKKGEFINESGYEGISVLHFSLYNNLFGFVPPDESIDSDPESFIA